jgi:hypothetical protein
MAALRYCVHATFHSPAEREQTDPRVQVVIAGRLNEEAMIRRAAGIAARIPGSDLLSMQ